MLAVKENKEVKILDIQKDKYVEAGYTILDDKLKVIAKPFDESEKKVADLEKNLKESQKENEALKAEKAELEKKVADLEKKVK